MEFLKRHGWLLLFIVLSAVQVFQIRSLTVQNSRMRTEYAQQLELYNELKFKEADNELIEKMQHYWEDLPLKDLRLRSLSCSDTLRLHSLLSDECRLVICLSGQDCSSCYLPFLQKAAKLASSVGRERILILGDFESKSALKMLLQDNGIDLDAYLAEGTMTECCATPSSFLIKSDRLMTNVFIPAKSNPAQTDHYLEMVGKRLMPGGGYPLF